MTTLPRNELDSFGGLISVLYALTHSARPNLGWVWSGPAMITFSSKRAIKQGEELTHDYTRDWWAARDRHPR
jgi:SET domain-containing protein